MKKKEAQKFFDKLTIQEKLDIAKRYQNKELKIITFGLEHGLNLKGQSLPQLLGELPTGISCEYCDTEYVGKINSASTYNYNENNSLFNENHVNCPNCHHYPARFSNKEYFKSGYYSLRRCQCKNCKAFWENEKKQEEIAKALEKEKRLKEIEKQKENLKRLWETEGLVYYILGFGAIFEGGTDDNYQYILPVEEQIYPIMPSLSFRNKFFQNAYLENILLIKKNESKEFLDLNDKIFFKKFWRIDPLLELKIGFLYLANDEQIKGLFLELQSEECRAYLEHIFNSYSLEHTIGQKTVRILEEAVYHFSASEIFFLIWCAGRNACAYAKRNDLSNKHEGNLIVHFLEDYLKKARNGEWRTQFYNRPKDLPQSFLSKFFMRILESNEDTLYLNKENLTELIYKVRENKLISFDFPLESPYPSPSRQEALPAKA